ncbi:DUF5825 family protein [Amycolatopsis tolypomycina]|uniref:DUF5825 family protein n=1 Tax=Amycolatopsis tolypomycina TaxID=208445 RepID=UPI0033B09643
MRTLSTPHPEWPVTVEVAVAGRDPGSAAALLAGLAEREQTLRLSEPVTFGRDPGEDVAVLSLLIAAAAVYVPVDWTLDDLGPLPDRALWHLPPPGGGDAAAARWREVHRPGLCTYRNGPGFVLIQDRRPTASADEQPARIRVERDWVAAFHELAEGHRVRAGGRAAQLLPQLVDLHLAVRLADDHAVVLPYHARRRTPPGHVSAVRSNAR